MVLLRHGAVRRPLLARTLRPALPAHVQVRPRPRPLQAPLEDAGPLRPLDPPPRRLRTRRPRRGVRQPDCAPRLPPPPGADPHHYEPVTYQKFTAKNIADCYGSIPKGVILEDTADGIEDVFNISFNSQTDEFIINDESTYHCPLRKQEAADIFRSIAIDNRLGVSIIIGEKNIVYGALRQSHTVPQSLFAADMFLISIVFGWNENLRGVTLPGGYHPQSPANRRFDTVS